MVYARPQSTQFCQVWLLYFDKWQNYKQFTSIGAFSAKFSTTPSGKTMDGTQKSLGVKWWHGPPLSPCKIWWKSNDARQRERIKCDVFHFFNFFYFRHSAGSAADSSASIVFTHRPVLGFFAPQGRHAAPIKVKFGGPLLRAKFHLDRSRGKGLRPPKLKKIEFYQYNCP